MLLTGCICAAEVECHFANGIGESVLGECRGKDWGQVMPFSRREQRDRRSTENAKRMSTGLAKMKFAEIARAL